MPLLNYSHTLVARAVENITHVQDMFDEVRAVINALTIENLSAALIDSQHKPGDLIIAAGATRSGALRCDHASYLRSAYPALFTALGGANSPWGLPDGDHFNVPDLGGRALVGAILASGSRDLGDLFGSDTVTLTALQSGLRAHVHKFQDSGGEALDNFIGPSGHGPGNFDDAAGWSVDGAWASGPMKAATALDAQDAHSSVQLSAAVGIFVKT